MSSISDLPDLLLAGETESQISPCHERFLAWYFQRERELELQRKRSDALLSKFDDAACPVPARSFRVNPSC
jgi:hypothetical protein